MDEVDEHTAHVLDGAGVTAVRMIRTADGYSNAESFYLSPGAVVDIHGMSLRNGESFSLTFSTVQLTSALLELLD